MARWEFISDILIRAYSKAAQSTPIIAPLSKLQSLEHIQAFVDDSHGLVIQGRNDETTLISKIQHNIQKWESLLHTFGGKLEIDKCRLVHFNWASDNHEWHRLTQPTQTEAIQIIDHESNQLIHIPEIQTNEAYKLLGIQMAP
jgi:hypothetical protein